MPLLPRAQRVRAIIATGLRREFRRPAAIVVTGMGAALVTISSIVSLLFGRSLFPGSTPDVSSFAMPASNGSTLFFVILMAAFIGSGLIADALHLMAFPLYLRRPITNAHSV